MKREEFLEKWAPYPVVPNSKCEGYQGRILSLEANRMLLISDGKELAVDLNEASLGFWKGESFEPLAGLDVLAANDIVHCSRDGKEVVLLVPSHGELKAWSHETGESWSKFLQLVREFFLSQNFTEMTTPSLVPSPGMETYLEAFETKFSFGQKERSLFLPTSPEFHLKKLICQGWNRIFEIKTCFRDGELSEIHQPEFSMLEWYRAYSDLDSIVEDVEKLFALLGVEEVIQLSLPQFFYEKLGFALKPNTSKEELAKLALDRGLELSPDDSWDDIFFRLFLQFIEPELVGEKPIVLRYYPPSQAALSRVNEDGWADRFEVYWRGFEIANAYQELNDPKEQARRIRQSREEKKALSKKPFPIDEEFLKALEYGMPPAAGIALGMDRLFMACNKIDCIEEARAFPLTLND